MFGERRDAGRRALGCAAWEGGPRRLRRLRAAWLAFSARLQTAFPAAASLPAQFSRCPRWRPSTGPGPAQSLPCTGAGSRQGECKPTPRLVVLFSLFFLVIKPDEVSCLQFPLRAVIFPRRDRVFWGGFACTGGMGGGDVEYFENYSFLVGVEAVGNPGALGLPCPRKEA